MGKEKHNLMRTAMLLLLMMLTSVSAWAQNNSSGTCGATANDNVSWAVTDTNGDGSYDKLTISGTGAMADDFRPWSSYRNDITSVVIGNGVTIIGERAFIYCENLTSVTIPVSVQTIGSDAFMDCVNLTSITIPASVTDIGHNAFYECSNLAHVNVLATTPPTLGNEAFGQCSSPIIYVPQGSRIYYFNDAYWSDYHLVELTANGNCGTTGHESEVFWFLVNNTLTISGTGDMADFQGSSNVPWKDYNSDITSVVIESGVTIISGYAFYYCTNLATVTFAAGSQLTSIGAQAFYKTALNTITIPASVESIGDYAFANSALESVIIPASVEYIGKHAFANSALQKMYVLRNESSFPEITQLGNNAFDHCNNLAIVVPAAAYDDYNSQWFSGQGSSVLKPGYTVTCGTNITATPANNGPLVEENETVTLSYTGTIPEGKVPVYTVKKKSDNSDVTSTVLSSTQITMPDYDIIVSAALACTHNKIEHAAVAATCTEAGNTAYWECETCHEYFSDAAGTTEIAENSWVIDALGHDIVNSVCTRCNGVTTLYIDADGTEKNEVAVPLTGSETNLSAGWYVVNSDIDYASTLTFTGDAHLILCDGATLTVKNIEAATNLNIYAQSGNSGKLTVNAAVDDTYGIYSYNEVNINGGTVSIENAQYGINTYDINISGAKVFIDNTEQGIHTRINDSSVKIDNATVEITAAIGDEPCAIYVCDNLTINNSIVKASAASTKDGTNFAAISAGSIDISGGKSYVEATASSPNPSVLNCGIYAYLINITDATVSASAESTAANTDKGIGIYSNGDITINSGKVTANGDYIGMSADNHNITLGYNNFGDYIYASSYSGIVNIKDGKAFTYDNGAGSATPYNVSAIDIAGKYLFPVVNEITLKANSDGANNYWATFYCGHTSFTADGNTTIYKGAVNGNSVRLTSVEDIPAGNAVVLKSSKPTITLTAATTTTTSNTDFTDNDLKGTDIDIVPPANTYCLTKGASGVGFYQYLSTYGNIPANRAYLVIAGGNGAPAYSFLGFDEDDADGIGSLTPALSKGEGVIYDLQGRKVAKPTRGLYIVNGKKVIKTP